MNRVMAAVPRLATQVNAVSRRQISSSLVRSAKLEGERVDISHIKAAQKHFQIDDGTPVYLKGGFIDKLLFGTTVVLCVVGVGYGSTVIYALAVPPQN